MMTAVLVALVVSLGLSAPSGPRLIPGSLIWDASVLPDGSPDLSVTTYTVYAGSICGAWGSQTPVGVVTTYALDSLPDVTTCFAVSATNANGESALSETITYAPTSPATEVCGDGLDNDGDGLVDEGCAAQTDTIVYVLEVDNQWYRWTGTAFQFITRPNGNDPCPNVGLTAEVGGPAITANGDTWAITSANIILRNGASTGAMGFYVRVCPAAPPADTIAPTVPSGLAVAGVTETSVSLSWNPSTDTVGVTGYGVYRDGARVLDTSASVASLTGLACGTGYLFSVDAVDAAGNRSAMTPALSAQTAVCSQSPPPPPPPDPCIAQPIGFVVTAWPKNASAATQAKWQVTMPSGITVSKIAFDWANGVQSATAADTRGCSKTITR